MVYFSDIGLRNYMLGIFGNLGRPDDLGLAFQNLVFLIGWVITLALDTHSNAK